MGRPVQEGLAAMCFGIIIDPLTVGKLLREADPARRQPWVFCSN